MHMESRDFPTGLDHSSREAGWYKSVPLRIELSLMGPNTWAGNATRLLPESLERERDVRRFPRSVQFDFQLPITFTRDPPVAQTTRVLLGCDLTRPTDRFLAVAGLKEYIRRETRDTYIAGIWLVFLIVDLLWICTSNDRQYRTVQQRAPSWSWASMVVIERRNHQGYAGLMVRPVADRISTYEKVGIFGGPFF